MSSNISIKLTNNVNSEVYVYKDGKIILTMKRKFLFGSKIKAEIYENDKLLIKFSDFMLNLKIIEQNLANIIKIKNHNLFFSEFEIGEDKILIKSNLLYFLNKRMSKIYLNSKIVAKVNLKKIFDSNGINLEIDFTENQSQKEFEIIVSVLLTSLHLNI